MKKLVVLFMLAVVLAIVRSLLVALVAALVLSLVVSFIARPRDTLVFLGCLGLLGLVGAQPLACIITLGVVAIVSVVANAKARPRTQTPLTDACELGTAPGPPPLVLIDHRERRSPPK